MRFHILTSRLIKAGLAASSLLLANSSFAQLQINLTAGPATATLPDGSAVPMWGYTCGTAVAGSAAATCTALNPAVQAFNTNPATLASSIGSMWSPVVITVPPGQVLQINLTNKLTFQPPTPAGGGAPPANNVPTSLTIVGQLGGGLGSTDPTCADPANGLNHGAKCTPSPAHAQLGVSWATPNTPGGANPTFAPPPQPPRVQSFATEVAAGATTSLVWNNPNPGTYLIESGTHPSIQGSMGLYGILVVTTAPTSSAAGNAYGVAGTQTAVSYNAEIPLLLSEIDPVQNAAVQTAVGTAGFSETAVWSGQPGGCGDPGSATHNTCYPPTVNYTPLYYTINGVAFDKSHASASWRRP
jgi:FtsP/CotA-like multicopper oxidase with cupredoxin domain